MPRPRQRTRPVIPPALPALCALHALPQANASSSTSDPLDRVISLVPRVIDRLLLRRRMNARDEIRSQVHLHWARIGIQRRIQYDLEEDRIPFLRALDG